MMKILVVVYRKGVRFISIEVEAKTEKTALKRAKEWLKSRNRLSKKYTYEVL